MDGPLDTERMKSSGESWFTKAWEALRQSLVNYRGQPVGIIAASANSSEELTYDQVYYNEPKQKYSVDETWGNPPALTSDSDSWMMKSAKRRKLDSHTHTPPSSVTRIVTVKTTFNDDVIKFNFPISSGLLNLKNIVAQKFDLKSNRFCLKYIDKEKDLILIAIDEDLKLAVNTTAVNNCISLIICLPDGVCAQNRVEVIPPTLEFVADNFTSDSESLVLSTGEKTHQGKKRKPESGLLLPVTGWVTAKITYKKYMKVFPFCISSGVTKLENRVARSFKLKGKKLRLKYWDEDDDLIWVACDEDLKLAVVDTVINNTINLICLPD